MIKQKASVNGTVKMVEQSLLTKKDDNYFYYYYNEDMTVDYDTENSVALKVEYEWAASELESSDIEWKLQSVDSSHKNSDYTLDDINTYQEALRDYASYDAETGVYSTNGDRPSL